MLVGVLIVVIVIEFALIYLMLAQDKERSDMYKELLDDYHELAKHVDGRHIIDKFRLKFPTTKKYIPVGEVERLSNMMRGYELSPSESYWILVWAMSFYSTTDSRFFMEEVIVHTRKSYKKINRIDSKISR